MSDSAGGRALTGLLAWARDNPGRLIAYTVILLAFGGALGVSWLEGWIGAPPYRTGCPTITRTGACP